MKNPANTLIKFLGSRGAVAKHFNKTREAVRIWTIRGIPPDHALDVEELTDGAINIREILVFSRKKKLARRKNIENL